MLPIIETGWLAYIPEQRRIHPANRDTVAPARAVPSRQQHRRDSATARSLRKPGTPWKPKASTI